jgi:hypothetical protein
VVVVVGKGEGDSTIDPLKSGGEFPASSSISSSGIQGATETIHGDGVEAVSFPFLSFLTSGPRLIDVIQPEWV